MGLHQLQNFCTAKETISRMKSQVTEWEKIIDSYLLDKRLIFRIYKKFKKLNIKRTNNPISNRVNELKRQSSKELQMMNKYMRKCSTPLAIKEMQFKTTLRLHFIPFRMAIIPKANNKCW
jgi:phenylalanyl-tRNA synthetase alpha subunit